MHEFVEVSFSTEQVVRRTWGNDSAFFLGFWETLRNSITFTLSLSYLTHDGHVMWIGCNLLLPPKPLGFWSRLSLQRYLVGPDWPSAVHAIFMFCSCICAQGKPLFLMLGLILSKGENSRRQSQEQKCREGTEGCTLRECKANARLYLDSSYHCIRLLKQLEQSATEWIA